MNAIPALNATRSDHCRHPSRNYLLKHWPRCSGCGVKLLDKLYISPLCHHNLLSIKRPKEPRDWYGFLCEGCNDWSLRRPFYRRKGTP